MKKLLIVFSVVLFITSCASDASRFIVTNLGYEPSEVVNSYIYALPKTNFKVSITYEKHVIIPGPYADYAVKFLGIENVPKERKQVYSISDQSVYAFTDADAECYYSINVLEGMLSLERLKWASEKGLILFGDYYFRNQMSYPLEKNINDALLFTDLSSEKNAELTKQTIYKTIITDTSFVKVPVTTEQLQRKTLEKKAEEAANLILEIRTDRYYLAGGMVDPYPTDFDLKTALESLDGLESEYLSLFIGKDYVVQETIEYDLTPGGSLDEEHFEIDMFTTEDGHGQVDGESINVIISPSGTSKSTRNLLPQEPEEGVYNRLYYRMPELADVYLTKGSRILHKEKVSIFQSGALVNEIIQ